MAVYVSSSSGKTLYGLVCREGDSSNPLVTGARTDWAMALWYNINAAGTNEQCAAAASAIKLMLSTGNAWTTYQFPSSWGGNNSAMTAMSQSIGYYGVSSVGAFGNSIVQFSGSAQVEYWSTHNLYGEGSAIPQPPFSNSSPGLSASDANLMAGYISTLSGGRY